MDTAVIGLLPGRARRGFSLIELGMVLAIISLLIGGVMLLFVQADHSRRVEELLLEISTVEQVVHSQYQGRGDYTGITNTDVGLSGMFPDKWVGGKGTTLSNPFGATLTLGTDSIAGPLMFDVAVNGIPFDACVRLIGQQLGADMSWEYVNGIEVVNGEPVAPATAAIDCSSATNNTISWSFR